MVISGWAMNKALREESLTKCHENPGELKDTPNCVNVIGALRQMVLEKRAADSAKGGPY